MIQTNRTAATLFSENVFTCHRAADARETQENQVQKILSNQENKLAFWTKEMKKRIENLGEERKRLDECVALIKHNRAKAVILKEKAECCLQIGIYQKGSRVLIPGSEADTAQAEEREYLESQIQELLDAETSALKMKCDVRDMEMLLTNDLESKLEAFRASKLAEDLHIQVISPVGDSQRPSVKSGDPTDWLSEAERKIERSLSILEESQCFRRDVEEMLQRGETGIHAALHKTTAKIQEMERLESLRLKKHKDALATVTRELSTIRERCNMLESETEAQERHLQHTQRRLKKFQDRPVLESIADPPILQMQKQCRETEELLSALKERYKDAHQQMLTIKDAQTEMQKAVNITTRKLFMYRDEISSHRRGNTQFVTKGKFCYSLQ